MAKAFGGYSERITDPNDIVPALKRGIAATERGEAVLLEFITREEPIFPDSNKVLKEFADRELAKV